MLRSIGKQSGESVELLCGKVLQKRKVLSLEWKSEGVMDNGSGESMEPMGEVSPRRLCEPGLERLECGHYIHQTTANYNIKTNTYFFTNEMS